MSLDLAVGMRIAERYQIERVIAVGEDTTIVAARHIEIDQRVAIKVLVEDAAAREACCERFLCEARAGARLQSAHACRVLDLGSEANGTPYLIMEYLEGCDLSRELERRGLLPVEEAFDCVLQACEALAEAHAAGIVHRALSPKKLFWANLPDGTRHIKVLGFGVPKAQLSEYAGEAAVTMSSGHGRSAGYLSPEQLDAAQAVDERADIWGLGVVLYELLCGRPPFHGETIPALVHAVLTAQPRPLSQLQPGVPAGIDAVIAKALDKRSERRYGSVAEFVSALIPLAPLSAAEPLTLSSSARVSQALNTASPGAQSAEVEHHVSLGHKRQNSWLAALLLALGAGVLFVSWQWTPTAEQSPVVETPPKVETGFNAGRESNQVVAPSTADSPKSVTVPSNPVLVEAPSDTEDNIPHGLSAETQIAPTQPKAPVAPDKTPVNPSPAAPMPASVTIPDFGGRR
jgi:serine/threonine-protein kinase